MDIGLNKRPTVVSWDDLKECMCARFVPPHYRKYFCLNSKGFGIVPNIRLTINKSPSQGISQSLSLRVFEGEGELDLEDLLL